MLVSSKETRRSFLQQFATWSAVAGGAGLGAAPIFGAEPESCAGPKPPATAIPWKPDTNPILPRPAASTLTDADVTRLRNAYQAANLDNVMCRSLLSVDWQGFVYDCDFNQMLGLPLVQAHRPRVHLSQVDVARLPGNSIRVADHCYGCTAGQGSSCGGALGD